MSCNSDSITDETVTSSNNSNGSIVQPQYARNVTHFSAGDVLIQAGGEKTHTCPPTATDGARVLMRNPTNRGLLQQVSSCNNISRGLQKRHESLASTPQANAGDCYVVSPTGSDGSWDNEPRRTSAANGSGSERIDGLMSCDYDVLHSNCDSKLLKQQPQLQQQQEQQQQQQAAPPPSSSQSAISNACSRSSSDRLTASADAGAAAATGCHRQSAGVNSRRALQRSLDSDGTASCQHSAASRVFGALSGALTAMATRACCRLRHSLDPIGSTSTPTHGNSAAARGSGRGLQARSSNCGIAALGPWAAGDWILNSCDGDRKPAAVASANCSSLRSSATSGHATTSSRDGSSSADSGGGGENVWGASKQQARNDRSSNKVAGSKGSKQSREGKPQRTVSFGPRLASSRIIQLLKGGKANIKCGSGSSSSSGGM